MNYKAPNPKISMESTPIKKPKLTKDQLGTFLSDYLIFDILVNLPVKSIVCFRGLSKFWHSQLYSPLFIKDRLRLSKSDEGLEKLRMIIIYPFHCLKSCSLYSLYHEPYGYSVYLNFPMNDFRKGVHLVGSCNELVCFYVEQKRITHHLFVWNPCIGEWRYLPTSEGYHWDSDFGFGYSDTVDDYKVVKVVTQEGKLGRSEVFSWATDSWKKIDDFPVQTKCVLCHTFQICCLSRCLDRFASQNMAELLCTLVEPSCCMT